MEVFLLGSMDFPDAFLGGPHDLRIDAGLVELAAAAYPPFSGGG